MISIADMRKGKTMNDLIEKLSNLRSQFNCFNENERDAYHTLSEAIKALSEQPDPCEDAVSRREVIDAIGEVHPLDYNAQAIKSKIEKLPSVMPKWKKGKWEICNILDYAQRPSGRRILRCPFCGYLTDEFRSLVDYYHKLTHFCPNCGAEMKGEEDE